MTRFTRVLEESDGVLEKALADTSSPPSSPGYSSTGEGGGSSFLAPLPSTAKLFHLVPPEGLSRCLIIKGV